jgi:hypothetical protein
MKKGKSCVLKGFKNLKCSYGTVDAKNFKSLYLNIQTWAEPKIYLDDWTRQVSYFLRQIKMFVSDIIDKFIFDQKIIVDLDLRPSGIFLNKRSFMNLEITFFIKGQVDFKSVKIKNFIKKITNSIKKELFEKSDFFNFHLRKKDKMDEMVIV